MNWEQLLGKSAYKPQALVQMQTGLRALLDGCEDDLNSLISEDNRGYQVPAELSESFRLFLDAMVVLYPALDEEALLAEAEELKDESRFWPATMMYCRVAQKQAEETAPLMALQPAQRREVITMVFDTGIVYDGMPGHLEYVGEDILQAVYRMLQKAKMMVIDDFMNEGEFRRRMTETQLDMETCTLVWNLIEENKEALRHRTVMERITRLDKRVATMQDSYTLLLQKLAEMLGQDEDDEDDSEDGKEA